MLQGTDTTSEVDLPNDQTSLGRRKEKFQPTIPQKIVKTQASTSNIQMPISESSGEK